MRSQKEVSKIIYMIHVIVQAKKKLQFDVTCFQSNRQRSYKTFQTVISNEYILLHWNVKNYQKNTKSIQKTISIAFRHYFRSIIDEEMNLKPHLLYHFLLKFYVMQITHRDSAFMSILSKEQPCLIYIPSPLLTILHVSPFSFKHNTRIQC